MTESLRVLFSDWISFLSMKLDDLLGFETLGLLGTAECVLIKYLLVVVVCCCL